MDLEHIHRYYDGNGTKLSEQEQRWITKEFDLSDGDFYYTKLTRVQIRDFSALNLFNVYVCSVNQNVLQNAEDAYKTYAIAHNITREPGETLPEESEYFNGNPNTTIAATAAAFGTPAIGAAVLFNRNKGYTPMPTEEDIEMGEIEQYTDEVPTE